MQSTTVQHGVASTVTPAEAEQAGAFREDALDFDDAVASVADDAMSSDDAIAAIAQLRNTKA